MKNLLELCLLQLLIVQDYMPGWHWLAILSYAVPILQTTVPSDSASCYAPNRPSVIFNMFPTSTHNL